MEYQTLKSLKSQVRFVLETQPRTRNSDRLLVEIVCTVFHYDAIEKTSSIKRFRRWFNHRGEFLPTDDRVAKSRKLNMDTWRVAMGYPTIVSSGTVNPSWIPPFEKDINVVVSKNQSRMF